MKQILALITVISISYNLRAQQNTEPIKNPPINMEILVSNRGVGFQLMVNKKIQSIPKLGFFSVTNVVGEWGSRNSKDYMTQGNLTYKIIKGFDVVGGFHMTNASGFRPTAGLMYSYKKSDFMFVVYPRIDLMKNGVIEGFALIEYKPRINNNWKLYTRIQALYGQTLNLDLHARSYLVARLGLSYREFNFGIGTNLDRYGSMKKNINSFGVFFSVVLF